jgi:hypothetical protein
MLFYFNNIVTKNFSATCAKEKPVSNSLHIHLIEIIMQNFFGGNPFVDGIIGHSLLLSRAFFGGNPFVGGILGHNLLLSLAFFRWESLRGWDFSRPEFVVVSGLFLHDGIQAITKPFSRTFFFFHDGIPAITKPFSRTFFFFHDGALEIRNLGEDSFYTYITKSIYIGSASLKTLPLDLEPHLQGKEYGPSYSNTTRKSKANFFSRNHL